MLNEMLDIALVPYEEDRGSLEKRVACPAFVIMGPSG
jgi:hypothetical protein